MCVCVCVCVCVSHLVFSKISGSMVWYLSLILKTSHSLLFQFSFFRFLFSFILIFPLQMCYIFYNCPTLLQYSTLPFWFFFLFEVQFWTFLLTFLIAHLFFPWSYLGEYLSSSKAFFICVPVVSIFRIFLYGFLRVSLCLHYPSILAYFILFPSETLSVLIFFNHQSETLTSDLSGCETCSCSFCFVECFAIYIYIYLFFFFLNALLR